MTFLPHYSRNQRRYMPPTDRQHYLSEFILGNPLLNPISFPLPQMIFAIPWNGKKKKKSYTIVFFFVGSETKLCTCMKNMQKITNTVSYNNCCLDLPFLYAVSAESCYLSHQSLVLHSRMTQLSTSDQPDQH